nr:hypothetical protein [Opitutaceae bacterium]
TTGAITVTSTGGGITMANPAAVFATGSGALTLEAQGDIRLASLNSPSGQVSVTSHNGSILRVSGYAGTNITAGLAPHLRVETAGHSIDLTVLSDSVLATGLVAGNLQTQTIFRRTSSVITLYLLY